MGLKVVTDGKPVTVYRKDRTTQSGSTFTTYTLGISSKDKDGNWQNGYIDCQFKKCVEVANKAKIAITNSFYTVSEYQGKKYNKLFIMEFSVVEPGEGAQAPTPSDDSWMNIADGIDDSEMPFN